MTKPKLTYFDAPVSRGEECRMALHVAGVDFEDDRVKAADWPAVKAAAPYGAVPVFTVAGRPPIADSNAILTLIGRQYGLHPKDDFEAARHEAVMSFVEAMRHHVGPSMRLKDEAEKKAAREAIATEYLPTWAGYAEHQIHAGPFLSGARTPPWPARRRGALRISHLARGADRLEPRAPRSDPRIVRDRVVVTHELRKGVEHRARDVVESRFWAAAASEPRSIEVTKARIESRRSALQIPQWRVKARGRSITDCNESFSGHDVESRTARTPAAAPGGRRGLPDASLETRTGGPEMTHSTAQVHDRKAMVARLEIAGYTSTFLATHRGTE